MKGIAKANPADWHKRLFQRARPRLRGLALTNWFGHLPVILQAWLVYCSPLFDAAWFNVRTGVTGGRYRLARHFAQVSTEGTAGNPLFDAAWYRNRYSITGSTAQLLLHYWLLGDRLGLRPSPWFDAGFFRRHYRRPRWLGTALMSFLGEWRNHPIGHPLFDPEWYLESYLDVCESGQNPLLHFALYGMQEGRRPNGYFDAEWYLEKNPDVARSGIAPALHFCLYGATEGRSPGPAFDSAAYLGRHPAVVHGPMDALSHFLVIGRSSGADAGVRSLKVGDLAPRGEDASVIMKAGHLIDVVIPVYRGLEETRICIESVLGSASYAGMRLRLYNDASPEPEVVDYLHLVKSRHPDVILVENETNKGFVRTVNSAMRAACGSADFRAVILLNSDAEVANDWVERMLAHALGNSGDVATVTALSNNATICSYPRIGENELPPGFDTDALDSLVARINAGESVQVPTGVGFCMLITRQALQAIGFFDEDAFGRGYGEEVDFCMRANALGLRNLLALDVFVRHIGEVSFAQSSKPGKIIAQRIVQERYPFFNADVAAFVSADPALAARIRTTFARWRVVHRPVHVLFTHALGGGTERRVQEVAHALAGEGSVVIVRPVKLNGHRIAIENPASFDGFHIEVDVSTGEEIAQLLTLMGTTAIQVHHVLGFGGYLREGIAMHGGGFDFVVHDYYSVCPQVTLTDARSRYCGEPDASGCDACIAARPSHGAADIRNWRASNEWLVLGADDVLAPSQDTATRIERYTGRRPRVQYHEPVRIAPAHAVRRDAGMLKVVVIGVLANHKGRESVLAAASAAHRLDLPLTLNLIGDPQGEVPRESRQRLHCTGAYQERDLTRLIEEANPDAFLFAAPGPETYSYTLSTAMETGKPIVATDIGAFPERLRDYPLACFVPWDITGEELAVRMSDYLVSLQEGSAMTSPQAARPSPGGPFE